MERTAPLIALSVFLASCAVERAQVAESAQSQMVGMSREQVLACMGPPGQRMAEGKTEVWSYSSGGETLSHSFEDSHATGSATISGNTAYGSASGTSSGLAIAQHRYCVISVVMAGDAVSTVNYSGATGGLLTGGEQCAYAVRGCIRK